MTSSASRDFAWQQRSSCRCDTAAAAATACASVLMSASERAAWLTTNRLSPEPRKRTDASARHAAEGAPPSPAGRAPTVSSRNAGSRASAVAKYVSARSDAGTPTTLSNSPPCASSQPARRGTSAGRRLWKGSRQSARISGQRGGSTASRYRGLRCERSRKAEYSHSPNSPPSSSPNGCAAAETARCTFWRKTSSSCLSIRTTWHSAAGGGLARPGPSGSTSAASSHSSTVRAGRTGGSVRRKGRSLSSSAARISTPVPAVKVAPSSSMSAMASATSSEMSTPASAASTSAAAAASRLWVICRLSEVGWRTSMVLPELDSRSSSSRTRSSQTCNCASPSLCRLRTVARNSSALKSHAADGCPECISSTTSRESRSMTSSTAGSSEVRI
mmetsp:Transcript_43440/g.107412  ORF Transcript_43440/g.107412 Transcript_43440/m.107412 type:complete len:388 (+) Transcript_43440:60-1223(+)